MVSVFQVQFGLSIGIINFSTLFQSSKEGVTLSPYSFPSPLLMKFYQTIAVICFVGTQALFPSRTSAGDLSSSRFDNVTDVFHYFDRDANDHLSTEERDHLKLAYTLRHDLGFLDLDKNGKLNAAELDAMESKYLKAHQRDVEKREKGKDDEKQKKKGKKKGKKGK